MPPFDALALQQDGLRHLKLFRGLISKGDIFEARAFGGGMSCTAWHQVALAAGTPPASISGGTDPDVLP